MLDVSTLACRSASSWDGRAELEPEAVGVAERESSDSEDGAGRIRSMADAIPLGRVPAVMTSGVQAGWWVCERIRWAGEVVGVGESGYVRTGSGKWRLTMGVVEGEGTASTRGKWEGVMGRRK
jgi:hypothetical protein